MAELGLIGWIAESNKIEGIKRPPTDAEIAAHEKFIVLPEVTVDAMREFVSVIAPGKPLRSRTGLNVYVGNHVPPPGGPEIPARLEDILDDAADGDPYLIHQRYETLHPFMDGNGRSGRVLWLWMMRQRDGMQFALTLGFLHAWYYQSLQHSTER